VAYGVGVIAVIVLAPRGIAGLVELLNARLRLAR
jgi:hypothetical protein